MGDGTHTERTLSEGPGARLVVLVDPSGNCQVAEFLEQLASDRPQDFAKIQALLNRIKEVGPQNIKNPERVKALGDGLFELKAYQVRLLWIYGEARGSQRRVILLDGLIKKRDRHRPADLQRARTLKTEYEKGRTP